MAHALIHDRSEEEIPDSNEYRSVLYASPFVQSSSAILTATRQDRSGAVVQKPSQTAAAMVSWIHNQRSLYADRCDALEALPNAAYYPTGPEYHSDDWPVVLHHGKSK